jgi:hypothetical protein
VYEGLNVRPMALSWVPRLAVRESPELSSGTGKFDIDVSVCYGKGAA